MKAVKLNPTNKYRKIDIEYKNALLVQGDLIQDSKILNLALDILDVEKSEFLSVLTNMTSRLKDVEESVANAISEAEDAVSSAYSAEDYVADAKNSAEQAQYEAENAQMTLKDIFSDVEHTEIATAEELLKDYMETIGFKETKEETKEAGDEGVISNVELKEPAKLTPNKNLDYDSIKNCDTIDEDGVIKKGGVE